MNSLSKRQKALLSVHLNIALSDKSRTSLQVRQDSYWNSGHLDHKASGYKTLMCIILEEWRNLQMAWSKGIAGFYISNSSNLVGEDFVEYKKVW